MVDIGEKPASRRRALARCEVCIPEDLLQAMIDANWRVAKGAVIDTAIIAGTQAVKRTHELIPFCHGLPVDSCRIGIEATGDGVLSIKCEVSTHARTGIEMEALTGASIAALTVYDMLKALGHGIVIRELRLVSKVGGRHDFGPLAKAAMFDTNTDNADRES